MIISFSRNFSFVKTRKTASTSIEIWLSRFLGPQDVATTIHEDRVGVRGGSLAPLNYRHPLRQWSRQDVVRFVGSGGRSRPELERHSTAAEAILRVGPETWDRMLTFAVARNPWERLTSAYFWSTRNHAVRPGFERWLRDLPMHRLVSSRQYMSPDGELLVDRVLRYENLDEDLRRVATDLGLPPPRLGRVKSGLKPTTTTAVDVFSGAAADYVAFACAREIELMSYEQPAALCR